jgi:hypothetical protein
MASKNRQPGRVPGGRLTDPATQTPVATATSKIISNNADVHPALTGAGGDVSGGG